MALCIGDAFLKMAPVHECMDDVGHVPCIIRRMFEELDPLVWNGHGKPVVKTNASNISGDTKKRHSRNIFGDGDDIWEECVQSIVRLIRPYFSVVYNRLHLVDTNQHEIYNAFQIDAITKILVVTS